MAAPVGQKGPQPFTLPDLRRRPGRPFYTDLQDPAVTEAAHSGSESTTTSAWDVTILVNIVMWSLSLALPQWSFLLISCLNVFTNIFNVTTTYRTKNVNSWCVSIRWITKTIVRFINIWKWVVRLKIDEPYYIIPFIYLNGQLIIAHHNWKRSLWSCVCCIFSSIHIMRK